MENSSNHPQQQPAPLIKTDWVKTSVSLKLFIIGMLSIILLIPAAMITSIIEEREQLNLNAKSEVSSKWAKQQTFRGPMITIPIEYESQQDGKTQQVRDYWHILPDELDIAGQVMPKRLKRGIYEVVVYSSSLKINGSFVINNAIEYPGLSKVFWDEAFMTIGISDLRGISEEVKFTFLNEQLEVQPGSKITNIVYSGITINMPDLSVSQGKSIPFNMDLNLQGSENLSFIPVGKNTQVSLQSDWAAPSFMGNFLPKERNIEADGFDANWQVLQLNRNFPQQWVGNNYQLAMEEASFGLDLMIPLDDYQKSLRSAKYAIMTIALTFMVFFLTETFQRHKIHPIQYTIVGLALCLFYILLVSLSEHINFNIAYFISALSIILMISMYSISVFRVKKYSYILVSVLTGIYSFLFVILQLSDYALLMGSIGLSIILGGTMYFTRNIDWYQIGNTREDQKELTC